MTRQWRLVGASDPAVPASVRRFALRARQRRLREARPWLLALGLALVLASFGGLVGCTSLLGVARVTVTGATLVTPQEVRTVAAVRTGTPLARVDLGAVAARVRRLAPVGQALVTRDWPRTLTIRVVERTPVAVVPTSATAYLSVDASGVPFQTRAARDPALPLVRVAAPGPEDPTTRAALEVLAGLPPALRQPMAALVADAPARIRLELTDGRVIVWGDSTENPAKVRVALVLLNRPGKVLDVSAPNLVTVR